MLIKKWEIEDANELSKVLNNPNILKNLRGGIPYPYTIKHAEEFILEVLNAKKDSQYCWAIYYDHKVIGSVGVFRQSNIHYRSAEVGYYISEEYWGKGIMGEVIKEVCHYIFTNTDIIRIYAEPFEYNIASCRVLEKAGFQLEGTLRNHAYKNNCILNMKLYSMIKEEEKNYE